MSKPDVPTPPSPNQTAGAQTSTNVGTAIANSYLNNTNQVTQDGALDYTQTGSYAYTDPANGQTYNIPRWTATQTLSPMNQAIRGQTDATRYNLAGMANAQSQRIAGLLSSNMNMSGAPQAGTAYGIGSIGNPQNQIANAGQVQTELGDYGDVTRDYGPADNFSADRQRYEDAMLSRMNPQLERERGNIEQRLQDQGIRYGSAAYTAAMDDYNRQANDARYAAVAAGGQEQSRLTGLAAQRAAFQNEAQNQAYQQELGAGAFANQGQAQQFTQNATQGQFYNQALQQQLAQQQATFNAQNAHRNQWMNEQYAQRNQPINEISALLSGSQVSNPNFVNTPNTQIPTTDVAGITNQGFNQQMQAYQQQSQNYNQLIGGILGLGGGILGRMSDKREKTNVVRMGTVFGKAQDLPIYEFEYKNDPTRSRQVGPMAQDVEKIAPHAVGEIDVDGRRRKFIKAGAMGSVLKAA